MNLAENLIDTAGRAGGATALRLNERDVSYKALAAMSARIAGLLQVRGVLPGDRVGVMLPNVPEFGAVYYGVLMAGAIVVPMNTLLKPREVSFYLSDAQAALLLAWHAVAETAEAGARSGGCECLFVTPGEFDRLLADAPALMRAAARAPDDTAVILYTSGTTGTPKGAELTHANLDSNVRTVVGLHSYSGDDAALGALPLFHSFGQTNSLNAMVAVGARLSLLPRFDPGPALEIMQRDSITVFHGVPTMYAAMLNHPERDRFDLSTLRLCVSGGAALPLEVMRDFERVFGCQILEGYGLSETSPVASSNRPDRPRKPGSIGIPIDRVEMRVVDADGGDVPRGEVGEIVIRGPNVMKGYWHRPQDTREAIRDGWFYSGDLARIDEDGDFFIVDRKKDMIIRSGYNVYPREIEEVLYEHPAVREAAVIGIPDPRLGEEVGAAVALKQGHDVAAGELREFVRGEVAAYKYPRHVWIVRELPKGPTGKILKREIRPPVSAIEALASGPAR